MTSFAFPPHAVPSAAIAGSKDRFPVRRIFCVGQNYADHVLEMGSNPERDKPFFFSKPNDAIVDNGGNVPYPSLTKNFHFEIELVVAIGKAGSDIAINDALSHVFGLAVGIDFTRRDLQGQAKNAGRPWDWGKGCDHGAPCAPIHRDVDISTMGNSRIWLAVNGDTKQDSTLDNMIWPIADIISFCSTASRLEAGDLIFTGTPSGVGPVVVGDKVTGGIDALGAIGVTIT